MWESFFQAFALMLVFEGVMPFLGPSRYKQLMTRLVESPEGTLRIYGFVSMILGAIVLQFVHQ